MRTIAPRFRVKAVGMTFHDGYPDTFLDLAEYPYPLEVTLRREPDNAHDPNAVAVVLSGRAVGHVPRDLAVRLALALDAGARYQVTGTILIDPDHRDRPGLLLDCVEV